MPWVGSWMAQTCPNTWPGQVFLGVSRFLDSESDFSHINLIYIYIYTYTYQLIIIRHLSQQQNHSELLGWVCDQGSTAADCFSCFDTPKSTTGQRRCLRSVAAKKTQRIRWPRASAPRVFQHSVPSGVFRLLPQAFSHPEPGTGRGTAGKERGIVW